MSAELQILRHVVAELKAAPIYTKAAKGEQVMDVLLELLSSHERKIEYLKLRLKIAQPSVFSEEGNENGKG